ncbi:hypothetical protein HF319_08365 [Xanthomonas sp. Kuri4-1]
MPLRRRPDRHCRLDRRRATASVRAGLAMASVLRGAHPQKNLREVCAFPLVRRQNRIAREKYFQVADSQRERCGIASSCSGRRVRRAAGGHRLETRVLKKSLFL